jgi:D-amino peptidase
LAYNILFIKNIDMLLFNKSKSNKYRPKIWMYADMEGINNITKWEEVNPAGADYKKGSKLMTQEVNSVIKGLYKAGADNVFINDLHWFYDNLILDKLDKRATYCYGRNLNIDVFELKELDAVVIVGMHAKAHTKNAVLPHSWYLPSYIYSLKFGGKFIGEVDMIKLLADEKGIPLIFISGDKAGCTEAEGLNKNVFSAITKEKIGDRISLMRNGKANRLVEKKSKEAVKNLMKNSYSNKKAIVVNGVFEATLASKELSETIEHRCKLKKVPCKRKDSSTLVFKSVSFTETLKNFLGVLD